MVKSRRLQVVKPVVLMSRQEIHTTFGGGTSWKHFLFEDKEGEWIWIDNKMYWTFYGS
jgi:hypothetical protein